MIHFVTPYSRDKNFLAAIICEFNKVKHPDDWVCILDGDTMFLQPDFGEQLRAYTQKFPDTGMFTCYASRCSYGYQVPEGIDQENPSLIYHKMMSDKVRDLYDGEVVEMESRIAGHLMMIQKRTWDRLQGAIIDRVNFKDKKVLGVDTQITWSMIKSGLPVRLMKGVYILHYFRLMEGRDNKAHLL